MNKAVALASAVIIASTGFACGSLGNLQKPVDEKPLRFVDARSASAIELVLIIPKYSSATGVATGAGHGPGRMVHEEFLASPFAYYADSLFQPNQPDSRGILFGPGWLFLGRGVGLEGILAVSRSHQAFWLSNLWERRHDQLLKLQPLVDAPSYRARLLGLLSGDEIRGSDLTQEERDRLSLIPDSRLKLKFTAAERRRIREFLSSEP